MSENEWNTDINKYYVANIVPDEEIHLLTEENLIEVLLQEERGKRKSTVKVTDVTWEDYDDSKEGCNNKTIVYFSMSDGRTLEKEIWYYPSRVDEIIYQDFDGDGKEEIVVKLYFCNTATEYSLMYIYGMYNEHLVQVFPNEEFCDLYDCEIVELEQDDYPSCGLRIRTFEKMEGQTYVDDDMCIAYVGSEWKVVWKW